MLCHSKILWVKDGSEPLILCEFCHVSSKKDRTALLQDVGMSAPSQLMPVVELVQTEHVMIPVNMGETQAPILYDCIKCSLIDIWLFTIP